MNIRFYPVESFEGWGDAPNAVKRLIQHHGCHQILEIGAGANPTLDAAFVTSQGLHYTLNDEIEGELNKSSDSFPRIILDLSSPSCPSELLNQYDFVFSRMVNEHINDGRVYFSNISNILVNGGITVHWFSTLYALPFVVNKWSPDWLSSFLLKVLTTRDYHLHAKFKAYYSWSRGPSQKMIRRFENLGFDVLTYDGYFGHQYYQHRLPFLNYLEQIKTRWLLRHPISFLTSYAFIVLRKKAGTPSRNA